MGYKSLLLLTVVLSAVCFNNVYGYKSFCGNNLYYAPGLYANDQHTYFADLQSAGIKVLRVWLDGQSSGSTKGTNIVSYPSLEPYQIGQYNDTVLELVDALMLTAYQYKIKLLISMYSFNSLAAGDTYGKKYGTGYFYEQQDALNAFDNRLRHVLTHTHKTLGKQWKDLKQYIFAFEAQNEAMIGKGPDYIAAHQQWQCDRAHTIKSVLGSDSGILVTTGGASWLDESMQPDWFTCSSLDVLAIHAYGPGDFSTSKLSSYVQKAQQNGKMLILEEWGACYYTTSNNDCPQGGVLNPSTRGSNIKNWAYQISSAGIPWFYWQIIPNKDPHYGYDYEIGINDQNWNDIKAAAETCANYNTPFNFAPYLIE